MNRSKPASQSSQPASAKPMDESEKYDYMVDLYNKVNDYFLHQYMKLSHKNMDTKIQVLEDRLAGKLPPEIPNWDAVQDGE